MSRALCISLLLLACSGCVTWQVERAAPERLIDEQRPRSIRVVRKDSTELLIADPAVVSGEIVGVIRLTVSQTTPLKPVPVSVPLQDVASVAVATVDPGKTLLLLVPLGIAAGVVVALAL